MNLLDAIFQPMRATQPLDIGALGFTSPTPADLKGNPKMRAMLKQQRRRMKKDATQGELGVIRHPNGSWSHEVSTTGESPTGKGFANYPLLVQGQSPDGILRILFGQPQPEDFRVAAERARQRVAGGARLPIYKTIDQAVKAAQSREAGFQGKARK